MKKKKVVLLGDSIRLMGYGPAVPELLGPDCEVWQPEDNGRFISYILRQIFDHQNEIRAADVVHFNSGEWDICELFGDGPFTPEEFYVSQVLRVVSVLQAMGCKVIFATTTPVRPENTHNRTCVIERYNALVVPELERRGVAINDLFRAVNADIYKYVCDDTIHLSEAGIALCAKQTAEAIRAAL